MKSQPPTVGPRPRDRESQELLNRLRANQPAPEPVYTLDAIMLYPEPAPSPLICQLTAAAALALPVILMAVGFSQISSRSTAPAASTVSAYLARFNTEDDEALIRGDLLNLKRETARRGRMTLGVRHRGPESRIFKYFMTRLAPEACRGITYVEISAFSPLEGFSAKADCLEAGKSLEMDVRWDGRLALVTFRGYRGQEEFNLYPPPTLIASNK
ncbi:MAG: hypothetical protein LBS31_08000 [Candidatus Adiutrix sp.]|jgi:hypothetical protein|nr:hypothetical protein [Candidatus Adiutrix sp.]